MKKDNMNQKTKQVSKNDTFINTDKAKVDTIKNDMQPSILINMLPFLAIAAAILPGLILAGIGIQISKLSLLTLVLSAAVVFYIRMNSEFLLNKKYSKYIISFSYLICISLSILIPKPDLFCFWMIGGLLISMLIDYKLGLLIHFNITFIFGIFLKENPEVIIQLLIMGIILCLLSGYLKQRSTAVYACVIILSTNITLSFIIHNFIIDYKTNQNYLTSFFCVLSVLIISYFLYEFFNHYVVTETKEASDTNGAEDSQCKVSMQTLQSDLDSSKIAQGNETSTKEAETVGAEEYIETGYLKSLRTSYELLNAEDNILLQKMKEYSQKLYDHCVRIGDMSSRAASMIGADEMLAKAGGLYHDVGKMVGKNYIEEGLKIAEEYSFPKELKDIIKQHNIKYEKPSSVESAIVMLSDNLLSTIEYITQTGGDKYSLDKIIDNLFHMRIEKGTLDDSGLTVKDFKLLKDFYQQEFASKP